MLGTAEQLNVMLPPPWLPFSNNSHLSDPSAGAHPTQLSFYPPPLCGLTKSGLLFRPYVMMIDVT